MARTTEVTRTTRGALSGDEAEALFATVDETGHSNEERARVQHTLRTLIGASVEVDPLSNEDPSGANTDRLITRSAILFVSFFLVVVVVMQVGWGYVRRVTTTTLTEDASIRSLVSAMTMGVEWGGGFTQFPSEYTVHEADENTHRIEVTVVDSESSSELEVFSTAQVQASALAVNALLNPNIDTVVYHVKVRRDDSGHFQKARFFGFLRPTGASTPFMTFIWTKSTDDSGVRFNCSIAGVDNETERRLHDTITSKSTPGTIISYVIGDNAAVVAENVLSSAKNDAQVGENLRLLAEAADEARAAAEAEAAAQAEAEAQAQAQAEAQAQKETDAATDEDVASAASGAAHAQTGDETADAPQE